MRNHAYIAAALTAASIAGLASPVAADTLDPTLSRLVREGQDASGAPVLCNPGGRINDDPEALAILEQLRPLGVCAPDHAAFKALVAQWGFALAPPAMHTARTTGFGGFQVSLQATYTGIQNGASYWIESTEGVRDPVTGAATSGSPPGVIQTYAITARKGFGFGFEVGMNVALIPNSRLITGGADARFAILEGLDYVPDLSVGGGVRTTTGSAELQITTMGLDAQLGYRIPLMGQSILTPRFGYQFVYIWGNSGLTDLTPATDALGYCGYAGTNVPGTPDTYRADRTVAGQQIFDGQPVCAGSGTNASPGSPLDFNNTVVFENAEIKRHRLLAGLEYQYDIFMVGGQFAFDVVPPKDAQTNSADSAALANVDWQYTLAFEVGVRF